MTIQEMMAVAGAAAAPATEAEEDELCAEVMRVCYRMHAEHKAKHRELEQLNLLTAEPGG